MKIHIDLDCFFVSAERTVDATLIGKPVGVGGRSDTNIFDKQKDTTEISLANSGAFVPTFFQVDAKQSNNLNHFIDENGRIRGILTTCSYEARAYDIKTGTTINEALQKCPDLIIKKPNMKLYQHCSHELRVFLEARIPLLEQASIDEFYGDLKGWVKESEVGKFIHQLKLEINQTLNLPVSIGAAQSKYTAKMATNAAKPFGTRVILIDEVNTFIEHLPIREFPGIGRKTATKLQMYGLKTLGDIRRERHIFLGKTKSVYELYERVCGIDTTPIKTENIRKSIGISRTFDPLMNRKEALRRVSILARHLSYAILRIGVNPTHFHLGIRYELGKSAKKEISTHRIFSEQLLHKLMYEAFIQSDNSSTFAIIRLSISSSNFTQYTHQTLSLIEYELDESRHTLSLANNNLREKYGIDTIRFGNELL
jgi:DNA polymerase IV